MKKERGERFIPPFTIRASPAAKPDYPQGSGHGRGMVGI